MMYEVHLRALTLFQALAFSRCPNVFAHTPRFILLPLSLEKISHGYSHAELNDHAIRGTKVSSSSRDTAALEQSTCSLFRHRDSVTETTMESCDLTVAKLAIANSLWSIQASDRDQSLQGYSTTYLGIQLAYD